MGAETEGTTEREAGSSSDGSSEDWVTIPAFGRGVAASAAASSTFSS